MLFPIANLRESTMASSKKLISMMTDDQKSINHSISHAAGAWRAISQFKRNESQARTPYWL